MHSKRNLTKPYVGTNMKERFNLREFCERNCVVLGLSVLNEVFRESLACGILSKCREGNEMQTYALL